MPGVWDHSCRPSTGQGCRRRQRSREDCLPSDAHVRPPPKGRKNHYLSFLQCMCRFSMGVSVPVGFTKTLVRVPTGLPPPLRPHRAIQSLNPSRLRAAKRHMARVWSDVRTPTKAAKATKMGTSPPPHARRRARGREGEGGDGERRGEVRGVGVKRGRARRKPRFFRVRVSVSVSVLKTKTMSEHRKEG